MNADPVPSYFTLEIARLRQQMRSIAPVRSLRTVTLNPRQRLEYTHRVSVGWFRYYKPKRKIEVLEDSAVPKDFIVLTYRTGAGKETTQIMKVPAAGILETVRRLVTGTD